MGAGAGQDDSISTFFGFSHVSFDGTEKPASTQARVHVPLLDPYPKRFTSRAWRRSMGPWALLRSRYQAGRCGRFCRPLRSVEGGSKRPLTLGPNFGTSFDTVLVLRNQPFQGASLLIFIVVNFCPRKGHVVTCVRSAICCQNRNVVLTRVAMCRADEVHVPEILLE